jgi:hypothetical protein
MQTSGKILSGKVRKKIALKLHKVMAIPASLHGSQFWMGQERRNIRQKLLDTLDKSVSVV